MSAANLLNTYLANNQTLVNNYHMQLLSIERQHPHGLSQQKILIQNITNNFNTQRNLLYTNYLLAFKQLSSASTSIPTLTTPVNHKKALLIGTNYPNTPYTLHGCVNDPNDLKVALLNHGFQAESIELLTDTTTLKPTKTNILNEITKFIQNSVVDDILFLSFSGHGSQTYVNNSDEEMIISSDLNAITDVELNAIVQNNLKAGVYIFILCDSCHSGTILDLKYKYFDSDNNNNTTIYPNNKLTLGNVILVSGCLDEQTSAEAFINNKYQGALTYAFIKVFETSNNYQSLLTNIRAVLKADGYSQLPQLSSGEPLDTTAPLSFL